MNAVGAGAGKAEGDASVGADDRLCAGPPSASAVHEFIRTSFALRRNVVKVWRRLPADLWFALNDPADRALSCRRESAAAIGIAFLVIVLVTGFGSVGYCAGGGAAVRCYPVIGKSLGVGSFTSPPGAGWYYAFGQSIVLVLWTVVPPLAGWALVGRAWIPSVTANHPKRAAVRAFTGQLLSVYFYVLAMVAAGAALMPVLIAISPTGSEFLRWCLWCFLFGESFFVPAVMWSRLIVADRDGAVFGRYRYVGLAIYLLLLVVLPIIGMVQQLE